jgi:hypothetical protein
VGGNVPSGIRASVFAPAAIASVVFLGCSMVDMCGVAGCVAVMMLRLSISIRLFAWKLREGRAFNA